MRLLLFHPVVAQIACRQCRDWMYNMQTGELDRRQVGENEWVADQREGPPPCGCGWTCPKGTFEQERKHVLLERNLKTWSRYEEQRASGGLVEDSLTRYLFARIDAIYENWQRQKQALEIANLLVPILKR